MTEHPYWAYGPDHGVPMIDALAEGRRAYALELAFRATPSSASTSLIIARAVEFERYLEGEGAA